LSLLLRLPGLTWGLPNAEHWYSYHPDERQIAQAAYNVLMSRDWNPQFFNYPSLFIYLTYFSYSVQTLLGLTTPPRGQAPWPFLHDVMLCGRTVSALLGAFTVPAVYLIGQKLAGLTPPSNQENIRRLEGGVSPAFLPLFAAFLMAVAPGHVQHSHFATVDVPATFFVTWALYFAMRATTPSPNPSQREGNNSPPPLGGCPLGRIGWGQFKKNLLLSAFLAGLAAATKYNAGLVLLAPLLVSIQNSGHPLGGFKIQNCSLVLGAAIFGFVLACPHSVLSTAQFLGDQENNGLLYELLVHSRQGHGDVFVNTGNGWLYHLTFNLPFAFTAPGALCGIVGLILATRSKNKLWLPLLVFAGVYFFTLGLSQVRFMRYLLPLLPILCLAMPLCFQWMPKVTQKISAFALALLMLIGATNVLYPFCVPDPRDQAADYLKKVTTKPVTVALINRPWFYTPPLWPQDYPPPSQAMSGVSPDGRFRFDVVGPELWALKNSRNDWLFANEFEYREEDRLKNRTPQDNYMLVVTDAVSDQQWFKHHPPLELPGRIFVPHDFLYTNPEQWIGQN
jgi:4-amino-4-deoxy-L-arabinose transferase-like glycosyltransferase